MQKLLISLVLIVSVLKSMGQYFSGYAKKVADEGGDTLRYRIHIGLVMIQAKISADIGAAWVW